MSKHSNERLKQAAVVLATTGLILMNYLAATGFIGGVSPEVISNKYPTFLTPAGYAFSIWGLIYLGLAVWSILQALPSAADKFASVRWPYIFSCLVNSLWLFFWHYENIIASLAAIFALLASLAFINLRLKAESNTLARAAFGTYFGWVSLASIVNASIALIFLGVSATDAVSAWIAAGLVAVASLLGIFLRHKLPNIAYPIAIAWALTAIAVKQSGKTPIVVAAAFGVIALLVSALSFVVTDLKKQNE